MEKILIKYSEFRYAEHNFNHKTWYKDNINCQINVTLLSFEWD